MENNESLMVPDPEADVPKLPTVDQAYATAGGPRNFQGQPLRPWSGRRRTASFELGMQASGSVLDPIRLLYSCIMPQSDVALAFRRPDQVIERMLTWAEKFECVDPTQKNYEEAAKLATELAKEVGMSQHTSEGDGTPTGN